MKSRSTSLRSTFAVFTSTVALAALLTMGAGTAFADTEHSDSVENNFSSTTTVTSGSYNIYDTADMNTLATYVSAGGSTAGVSFTLQNDVVLGSDWAGIGTTVSENNAYGTSSVASDSKSFDGFLYGNSKTITLSGGTQGVFAYLGMDSIVSNFTIEQASSTTPGVNSSTTGDYVGAVAGFSRGQIKNVTNNASVYAASAYNVGGIVGFNDGYNQSGTTCVQGCLNTGAVTGKQKVGGITGENAASIILCENDGKIVGTNTSSKNGVGGIAGRNGNNNTAREKGIITSCLNKGEVGSSSQKWVGGITGFQNSKSSTTDCLNTGTIVKGSGYYNPIVGNNEGTTAGSYYVGSLNMSGTTSDETGIKWESDSESGVLYSLLNVARNSTIVQADCWSGTGSATVLDRTVNANGPANEAIGSEVAAITVYLDGVSGSDSNPGTSASSPVKTLAKAVTLVSAGGTGSEIIVSNPVTVSSDVTIRQNITISWNGSTDATMFTVTGGKVTLGGDLTVTGPTGTGAVAFDLTGGSLVAQDNVTISAGSYAAKVANGQTMSINRSTISGTVYLYTGGLLNLPSELTSTVSVECEALTTSNINIATCGNNSIALKNKAKISIVNSNADLSVSNNTITAALASSSSSSSSLSLLNSASLTTESNEKVVYEWNTTSYTGQQVIFDGYSEDVLDKIGWKLVTAGDFGDYGWLLSLHGGPGDTIGKNKDWLQMNLPADNSLEAYYYLMPTQKIKLGSNSKLTFDGWKSDGRVLSVYVADDNSDASKFTKVKSITIGTTDNIGEDATDTPTTGLEVDLSTYDNTEKYVILGCNWSDNRSWVGAGGDEQNCYMAFAHVKITSEKAAATPSVSLSSNATNLKVGQEFTVNVNMKNITAAAQAALEYSDTLELVKVEAGSALTGDGVSFEYTDTNRLLSFCANEGTTDGTVAVATFKCKSAGDISVGLKDIKAAASGTASEDGTDVEEPEAWKSTVSIMGLPGDVNNSKKLNIVDAQIVYDMAANKYAEGSDARASLLACWEAGATYAMVEALGNVNGDDALDSTDAFAIQYAIHHDGKFGSDTE